jgi:hypothetical protein
MIGSQCVHAQTASPPPEVILSVECDILISDDKLKTKVIEELGDTSAYREEHGVYVDTVSPSFPFLPEGWENRTVDLVVGGLTVKCLETYDLAQSKLYAGRLKDNEMVAALIAGTQIDPRTLRTRIETISDLHLRAVLLARLQLVLESP